ncbi:MAG: hypothetical protein II768_01770 [Clostridia bacterium]|nr:hypothetical protein [Clostridia bacterium]
MKKNMKKKKSGGLVVTGVVLVAILTLFGMDKMGLGFGDGVGFSLGNKSQDTSMGEDTTLISEPVEAESLDSDMENEVEEEFVTPETIEIRIQGREYNYQNITYGNSEHTIDDLLAILSEYDKDIYIDLIVEDTATKNAVDDLLNSLRDIGFTNIRK